MQASMEKTHYLQRSDLFGAVISSLCAVHCTITPLFFVVKPVLETSGARNIGSLEFWKYLDFVFLVLSVLAVWYSSRHTNYQRIKWILWISWIFFATGLLLEQIDFFLGLWLMYIGSIALIITHIRNYRYCQKCELGHH